MTDTTWILERAALGELSLAEASRLCQCPPDEVQRRLAALRASNAHVLAEVPPRVFAAALTQRQQEAHKPARWVLGVIPLAAAGLALALFVGLPGEPQERVKGSGGPRLTLLDEQGASVNEGRTVSAGTRLQPVLFSGGQKFAALISVDGAGRVSGYFPPARGKPMPLEKPLQPFVIPNGIELDDAPVFERFFLVTSDVPLAFSTLQKAIKDGNLITKRLPKTARVVTLTLQKDRS